MIANGGTVRIRDGEFEPIDKLPNGLNEYKKGEFSNIELYKSDGVERFAQWNERTRKFYYYEKYSSPHVEEQKDIPHIEEQRNIPYVERKKNILIEVLLLLHSSPEPLTLTQICEMLGVTIKRGKRAIKQWVEEGKVIEGDRGYTIPKYWI